MPVMERINQPVLQPSSVKPGRGAAKRRSRPTNPGREIEFCQGLFDQLTKLMAGEPNSLCMVLTDSQLAMPVTD